MSIQEIENAVGTLSTDELRKVERALYAAYRKKGEGIIFDDHYGVVTEEDLVRSADEAFQEYDREEDQLES